jgi:hypothetical protein
VPRAFPPGRESFRAPGRDGIIQGARRRRGPGQPMGRPGRPRPGHDPAFHFPMKPTPPPRGVDFFSGTDCIFSPRGI